MARIGASMMVAALAVAALAGCGSSDDASSDASATSEDHAGHTTTVVTSSEDDTAGESGESETVPAATLLDVVNGVGNPNLPANEKVNLIAGGADREAVIEQFNGVLVGYPLTFDVSDVAETGDDAASAQVLVEGPHGGAPIPMTFVEQDNAWKLTDESFCALAAMGQVSC